MLLVDNRITALDHGMEMSDEDFGESEFAPGFRYELIEGRLYVSPAPNMSESYLENWLLRKLMAYSEARPDVLKYVTPKSRVKVPRRRKGTFPEPDIAAYRDFPEARWLRGMKWFEVNPILVVEVLVDGDANKDLTRNPRLYWKVPSIREYWVLSGVDDILEPTLIVHRRGEDGWKRSRHPFRTTYTTPMLPGFSLTMDPEKK